MKIAIVSQYFPPDKPGRIADELSQELARRGHSVRVLTAFPHYDTGKVPREYRQQLRHVESRGPVRVRRVPIFASHSRNAIGRIANYLSFPLSARFASSFVKDADVIYVHGTPATAAHVAYLWSKKFGIPYLYHVQDIWPESVTGSGFLPGPVGNFADRAISRWLRTVYASAAAVVAIAPSAQKLFVERGASADRVHLVYNWARDSKRTASAPHKTRSGLVLLYAGNLGALQDLETVLKATARLKDLEDVRLLVAGAGVLDTRLKELANELGLQDRVEFLGKVPPDDIVDIYEQADFQVVPLKNLDIFAGTIPSKFQAGLAHQVPVITTVPGDVSRLVVENRLGMAAEPENVESLADAFRLAYATTSEERQAFRERAREFYDAYLTKERAVTSIETILAAIAKRDAPEDHGRIEE
ncbi:glycosyltransferase family 4 protein [Microbacterium murale]|uniref:D-inositol 3-phosphate glycosyltransferase n=1 Tax=Microbacterium murale TaxID=1081040 RepID=A0ABU0PB62_9MICO|nr:glycosyltransferase family 4 protein [Microbacterium murale]MDQ0644575.1 colanic acid biosynthesis glycosyl transferase WcaI [Microbacterium murale]